MRLPLASALALLGIIVFAATAESADRDYSLETVLPTSPGKNKVRWWEFDWKYTRFSPVEGGAPVKLYFYDSEREVARRAKPQIAAAYVDYVEAFDYRPDEEIPFLLYNSHFEFESTTAFFIQESVLGVTSTQDLTMALPYWGEHKRFNHVMRHELAHQFTIQKILDLEAPCNPLMRLPLWFIEGVAEFYSQPELTPEVRAVLADRLLAERAKDGEGEQLPPFFDQITYSFERIYLMGHAQMRFVEQFYGFGTVRRLIERSRDLCGAGFFGPAIPFEGVVAAVVNQEPELIENNWRSWAEREAFPAGREANADAIAGSADLQELELDTIGDIDSFGVSPNGLVTFYRTFDNQTGISRLYLQDLAKKGSKKKIAEDQRARLVTLHPRDRRVTAVSNDLLVYIGRRASADIVFVRSYRRRVDAEGDVKFELGKQVTHDLSDYGNLIEGGYPAIDPQTGRVAFVGLDRDSGFLDVYVIDRPLEPKVPIRKLTNDIYAEQSLAYMPDGTLLAASDATVDGMFEIMRINPDGSKLMLSDVAGFADASAPVPDGLGGALFEAGATGYQQIYHVTDSRAVRISDVATAMSSPALDGEGNLLGLAFHASRLVLVRLPRAAWKEVEEPGVGIAPEKPRPFHLPKGELKPTKNYDPYALRNYSLQGLQLAAAGNFLAGVAVFTDVFKGHVAGTEVQVLGQERLDADVFYIDRSRRTALGTRLFVRTGLQLEPDFVTEGRTFLLQRYGGAFLLEYPFNRYVRVDGFVSPQGIRAYDFFEPERDFARRHRGTSPALEVGAGIAYDTLRHSLYGAVGGGAAALSGSATAVGGPEDTFGRLRAEFQYATTFLRGYERFFLSARIASGASLGGVFNEQFFIPAAYNFRALPPASLDLLGEYFALSQLEVHFPLTPAFSQAVYLQGIAGADIGGIAFEPGGIWDKRIAAPLAGINLGLGYAVLRLHFARPYDIGGIDPSRSWITHFSVALLPLAF